MRQEKGKMRAEMKKADPVMEENDPATEPPQAPMIHFDGNGEPPSMPIKFANLLSDRESHNPNFNPNVQVANFNGVVVQNPSTQIDRMQEVVDFVANLVMEDEVKEPKAQPATSGPPVAGQPQLHVDWFYRDPQGDTQGPFTAQDMSEWYKAGYFRESLMVRRSIDGAFMPLGQLVKVYGLSAPFMAATMMEPIQQPPPPVEIDPFRMQQHHLQQQRMIPPVDANGWNGMTPEQQIAMLNMRMVHQRPPVPEPFLKHPAQANAPGAMDIRRVMGTAPNDFYQTPGPANVLPTALPPQEMDPIQQLLMQLNKTGNGGGVMNDPNQWMKPAAPPQMMIPLSANNLEMIAQPVMNQPQVSTALNPNQVAPQNNWNQTPISIWDMPKEEKPVASNIHHMQRQQNSSQQLQDIALASDMDCNSQNGMIDDSSSLQFQSAPNKSHDAKNRKKLKEDEKGMQEQKKQFKEQVSKQNAVAAKKKPNDKLQQQKKEERSTQPAAPAPWMGHQTTPNGQSLAKIQKTETQRRELAAQRERDQQKLEMMQKIEMQKNDGLKWAAPPAPRVKTLDEIQAEEATAAAIQREREAVIQAKRDAAKKESSIVTNDVSIWNSTPHSMAWQQPKQWSGEQTSGSGFWEEPTKSSISSGGKTQMLSKSQTMATITTTKKPAPPQTKRQQPLKKPLGEKREKKDDNNNEFTSWCTKTLCSMNGNVDGK
jgi:GYF domain